MGEFVSSKEFEQYKESQVTICQAYREAVEEKINGMERSIKMVVYLTSSVLALISVSVQLYLHFIG